MLPPLDSLRLPQVYIFRLMVFRSRGVKGYLDLLGELKSGQVRRFYLFAGPEEFLKQEAVISLRTHLLSPAERQLNIDKLSGNQTSAEEIINCVATVPMFGQYRIIEVTDAQRLSVSAKEKVVGYLSRIPSYSVLVMIVSEADFRQKFYKSFSEQGAAYNFVALPERSLPEWIQKKVAESGKTIEPKAILKLIEKVGGDAGQLTSEIEKLLVGREKITEQLVEQVVGGGRRYTVYQLLDTVAERDLPKALVIFNNLVAGGEDLGGIIHWLSEHFFRLFILSNNESSPANNQSIDINRLGILPYFLEKYQQQARNFTLDEIGRAIIMIAQADVDRRLVKVKPELTIEMLLVNLCQL